MRLMNEKHEFMCRYPEELHIPQSVTISSYSTGMEQLRLSSEMFHEVMIKDILPKVVEPSIPIEELYEVDYFLMLRRLRLATYGPMFTVGSYYCPHCTDDTGTRGVLYREKRQVSLTDVGVTAPDEGKEVPLSFVLKPEDLIFTDATITFTMNKAKHLSKIEKHNFPDHLKALLPIAYSIKEVSDRDFIDIKEILRFVEELPPADFKIIHDAYVKNFSYGLNARGACTCTHCGKEGWFYAPINDYYFRPTTEDLKEWARLLRNSKNTI